jgi:Trk-type K+ transport systems, membrane components
MVWLATWILSIYAGLTIACMASYKISGMDDFDAMVHALTTVSTGGFSTSDMSIGKYVDNIPVQLTAIIFMITGALPFLAYIQLVRGNPKPMMAEPQVRALFAILILLIFAVTIFLINQHDMPLMRAFIEAGVNITSIMTGTGYANADYDAWGSEATLLFLAIIFMGGCAGSTCCGVKLFRYQIMLAHLIPQVRRLIHPSGVFEARYAGRRIADSTTTSVFVFMVMFFATFAYRQACWHGGSQPMSAISGAATTLRQCRPRGLPTNRTTRKLFNIPQSGPMGS